MLARIRASLSRPGTPLAPQELPPYLSQSPASDVESLSAAFSEEVESRGQVAARYIPATRLREYIAGLLRFNADASVAISDGQLIQEPCIGQWLLSP